LDSDDDTAVEMDDSDSIIPGAWPVLNGQVRFKDLLSHGVVVSVNGQPWNRIVAHVSDADAEEEDDHEGDADAEDEEEEQWDEVAGGGSGEEGNMTRRRPRRARFTLSAGNAAREAGLGGKRRKEKKSQGDRAVVVVYGLSPGKEYEIELRVVGMFGEGVDGIGTSFSLSELTVQYQVRFLCHHHHPPIPVFTLDHGPTRSDHAPIPLHARIQSTPHLTHPPLAEQPHQVTNHQS
jgi:hypothetical protein